MNNDLISRSELKKTIGYLYGFPFEELVEDFTWLKAIDNAPTVEAPTYTDIIEANKEGYNTARRLYERPKGEWLHKEFDTSLREYGQCSNCLQRERVGNFCRNCGADMKGKEDETN